MPTDDEDISEFSEMFASLAPKPAVVTPVAMTSDDQETDESLLEAVKSLSVASPRPATSMTASNETDDDPSDFMASTGIKQEREVPDITKPWMKHHTFNRVRTIEEVTQIVDECIARGRCALDLETEGFDNRITYDALGNPRTVHQIVGFCISSDGVTGHYIPVRHKPEDGGENLNVQPLADVEAQIRRLCQAAQPTPAPGAIDPLSFKEFTQKPQLVIYFWNAKFDQEFLFPITGIDWWHPDSFEDGYLAYFCHFAADKALGLKFKSPELLRDVEGNAYGMIELKELFIKGRDIKFALLSPEEPGCIKYACSDAICTFLLCEPPRPHEKNRFDGLKLARTKYAFTYRLEKQTSQVVRVMERNRAKVDRSAFKELLEGYTAERTQRLAQIQEFATQKGFRGLDPNSPKQLSDFLFTDGPGCMNITVPETADYPGGKPPKSEKNDQYKTGAEVLEAMVEEFGAHAPPILKWIVEYRGVEKMIGTYLTPLYNNPDKNNELRFDFKQTGAGTGRFSAPGRAEHVDHGYAGVPIHGIPNESDMRKGFLARDGYTTVKCDYAGQELRIVANLSGEPVWIDEFLQGDGDLHSITARAFFNKAVVSKDERKMGKIANFALIYGGGPAAIMRATGCDKVEGSRRKQAFDKSVPTFAKWIKAQHAVVKKDLGIWTAFKRWLAIPDANHPDRKIQAACERHSTNYPIQGSGADIMKISMVLLHKEFHKRGWLRNGGDDSIRMLLTVHDEVVFEIRHDRVIEAVPIIVDLMESPAKMAQPPWRVPLIVEPLVGPSWGIGYKCERAKPGYKPKEGEVIANGFIYGTIRVVDINKKTGQPKEKPGIGEVEHFRNEKDLKYGIRAENAAWLRDVKTDDVSGPAVAAPVTPTTASVAQPSEAGPTAPSVTLPPAAVDAAIATQPPPRPSTPPPKGRVVVMRITHLSKHTVSQLASACMKARTPENGQALRLLRLTDWSGETIIDPKLQVFIEPEKLAGELLYLNLGDGHYNEEP